MDRTIKIYYGNDKQYEDELECTDNGGKHMIIEYFDEFGDIANLYQKHVKGYERYIQEHEIPTIEIYKKIDEYVEKLPVTDSTQKKYKTALRQYITEISRNYW